MQNTEINKPYEYIELRIHSNHGQLDYTCLYRFRVSRKTSLRIDRAKVPFSQDIRKIVQAVARTSHNLLQYVPSITVNDKRKIGAICRSTCNYNC